MLSVCWPMIFRPGPCFRSTSRHFPFLTWARRAGAGHVSPLGLNIHPTYGLWHAFRAALLFPVAFDLPMQSAGAHPCETCADKPCLSACPVNAFNGTTYDVAACASHLDSPAGHDCMDNGCLARRACPVGQGFTYHPFQAQFFMRAFRCGTSQFDWKCCLGRLFSGHVQKHSEETGHRPNHHSRWRHGYGHPAARARP